MNKWEVVNFNGETQYTRQINNRKYWIVETRTYITMYVYDKTGLLFVYEFGSVGVAKNKALQLSK